MTTHPPAVIIPMQHNHEKQAVTALDVLREFCSAFSRADIMLKISLATKICLTADATEFQHPADRQDIYYVMENIALAVGAAYDVCNL